jgi:hypothetical protein
MGIVMNTINTMKMYFKILGIVLLFALQFLFVLPYYISANDWYEFFLGWFIILVVDPCIVYKIYKIYK